MGARRTVGLVVVAGVALGSAGSPALAAPPPSGAPGLSSQASPSCTARAVGAGEADWDDPATWSPARVPQAVDSVCLDGRTVVLHRSSTVTTLHDGGGSALLSTGVRLTVTTRADVRGLLGGPGTVVLPVGSTGALAGSAELVGGIRVVNRGAVRLEGTGSCSGSTPDSVLENAGTATLEPSGVVCGFSVVNDAGGSIRASGSGSFIVSPVANAGTVVAAPGAVVSIRDYTAVGAVGRVSGQVFLQAVHVPKAASMGGSWVLDGSVDGPGTLTVPAGSSVTAQDLSVAGGARMVNRGSMRLTAVGCDTTANGVLENAGTVSIDPNGVVCGFSVVNDAGGSIGASGSGSFIGSPVANAGTVVAAPGAVVSIRDYTAVGAVGRVSGQVYLQAVHVPKAASMGGSWILDGSVDGPGPLTVPAGSSVTAQNLSLADGARVVNRGSMLLTGSRSCGAPQVAVLENAGTLALERAATVCGFSVRNDAGATISTPSGGASIALQAPVVNRGRIEVGAGSGLVVDSLTSSAGSVLQLGLAASGVGYLGVQQPSSLAGGLVVSAEAGYTPPVGWTQKVVGGTTGTFAGVTATRYPDRHVAVTYSASGVSLQVLAGAGS